MAIRIIKQEAVRIIIKLVEVIRIIAKQVVVTRIIVRLAIRITTRQEVVAASGIATIKEYSTK